jgi:hypothetical protein
MACPWLATVAASQGLPLIILGIFRNHAQATAPPAFMLPAFSSSDAGILAVNRLRGLWKSLVLRSLLRFYRMCHGKAMGGRCLFITVTPPCICMRRSSSWSIDQRQVTAGRAGFTGTWGATCTCFWSSLSSWSSLSTDGRNCICMQSWSTALQL